ncbi:SGNH/GDSL hydrolase family protein [Streptomyces sp. ME19-01-6]|uniref:golvesin C-terminal-like domain-containing protein n=1 Tax=Streptomyces sp. ME19-01-6 TaxID=3028686 RepID=UPI0029C9DDBA|nr:SGNH/GDSL hydrolase family protein [Streptomyces sp. ME19-01-6]
MAAVLAVTGLTQTGPAWSAPPTRPAAATSSSPDPASGAEAKSDPPRQDESSKVLKPNDVLPDDWEESADRAVTVAGDGSGLHVLVAASQDAYQWRTVATLSEPGFGTDLWIGNACVTGSGKRAVVVYAPRDFTNKPELMERGGFAAVVDLTKGKVTKLADTVSLAYFNPGCGTGETAVLTQVGDEKSNQTRLLTVDTTTATVVRRQTEKVQVTSAVPTGDTIVGAAVGRLIRFDHNNHASQLTTTSGPAFDLRVDGHGGVSFLDQRDGKARARRTANGTTRTFAQGTSGSLSLQAGTSGRVFLTGTPTSTSSVPSAVRRLKAAADATVSSSGALAVDQAVSESLRSHVSQPLAATAWNAAAPIQIKSEVPATGKKVSFTVNTVDSGQKAAGKAASPALTGSAATTSASTARTGSTARTRAVTTAGDPTSTIDNDRTCSQPRNDPKQQAYQPTPNQVEWAVDMAIRGNLTSAYVRQGGWRTTAGLGTVNPQGMFPLPSLEGTSGGRIPAQVLLGVLAQESNLWQAEGGALPGQTSSTLASTNGFYGHPSDPATPEDHWRIDWAKADCGYGIGQQTDGMKSGEIDELPAAQQKAIALDYTSNIAVAARTLATKWNELHDNAITPGGIRLNTDDPAAPENWFAALWDYNSGLNYYVPASPTEYWGLGYLNNPSNPLYPPDRHAFLDGNTYADAGHPQDWSYAEKVLGWAAWPIDTGRAYADDGTANNSNTAGYSAAWWDSDIHRSSVKPEMDTFCNPQINACNPANPPRCEVDHLGETCDPPHWYHTPQTTWKVACPTSCGHEYLTYKTLRTELGNGNNGAGTMCNNSTAGFTIVDDVPSSVPTYTDGCGKTGWTNSGTLSFRFNPDEQNHYEAKGDLHQIGGGFGDHFWYAHARDGDHGASASLYDPEQDPGPASGVMAVTGTWKLNTQRTSWTRVLVHLPNTGSGSQQAVYTIHLGDGTTHTRIINAISHKNQWVSLGIYHFTAGSDFQGVSQSNYTPEGQADNDIAWDAVGFQWLSAKPQHIVAALGDSYSSGEGANDYDESSNQKHGTINWNACRRSANAWPRKLMLPGMSERLSLLSDNHSPNAELGFVACSGARTEQVDGRVGTSYWQSGDIAAGDGMFREIPQVDSGVLTKDTTLVTLTIGGNNYGAFVNAVTECANITDCADDDFSRRYKALIDKTKEDMDHTLRIIAERAPYARILLVGYPEILSRTVKCAGSWYFDGGEAAALATLANYMDHAQDAKVDELRAEGLRVSYANPVDPFVGHGGCDSEEWINKIVLGPNGDGDFHEGDPHAVCIAFSGIGQTCLSREAFHPKQAGTTGYARLVEKRLTDIGYTGT